MSPTYRVLVACLLCLLPLVASATPGRDPIRILLLGTHHMHNPGQDAINIESDDVLAPRRQRELEALADALVTFAPTKVAVEARVTRPDLIWPEPLDPAALGSDRNEITQVGQRVAAKAGLERLHAVDVEGPFDMAPLRAVKGEPGAGHLRTALAEGERLGADMAARLEALSIPAYLDWLNSDQMIEANHRFYRRLVRVSEGTAQPGADLVSDWFARNARICARILQVAEPGDRILVLYGVGHVYWLRECLGGLEDVELVHPAPLLQSAQSVLAAD